MPKITVSERLILSRLIHQENIATLIDETGLQFCEIRDDITNLLTHNLIEVFEDSDIDGKRINTIFYDLDNLRHFYFRATRRGQTALQSTLES